MITHNHPHALNRSPQPPENAKKTVAVETKTAAPHHTQQQTTISPDEKHQPKPIKHAALEFLDECKDHELIALQIKYGKTPTELDQLIKNGSTAYGPFNIPNQTIFNLRRKLDFLAIWGANGLYLYYRAQTGSSGITTGVNIYAPNTSISNETAIGLGSAFAAGGLSYILFSSAKKNAALSTLNDALLKEPRTIQDEFRVELGDHSERSFANALRYLASKSIIYTANITSGLSGVYAFSTQLNGLPAIAKWPLSFGILYFMDRFNAIFTNDKFYQGLGKFWFGKERLLNKKNISSFWLWIESVIQFSGTVLLRPYPNYYLLNEFALSYFPVWPDSRLVAAIVGIHTACTYWPTGYNRLFGSALLIHKRLLAKVNQNAIEQQARFLLQEAKTANNPAEIEKTKQRLIAEFIQKNKDELAKSISQKRILKTEPSILLTTGIRALTGIYVGATVIAGAKSKFIQGISGFTFGVLFGGILYLAENERVRNNIILDLLKEGDQTATERKDTEAPPIKNFGLIEFGSGVIIFLNVASSAFGTAGSLSLLGVTSPPLISLFTLLALGSATVSATYSYQPVVETSTALIQSITKKFSRRTQIIPIEDCKNIETHDMPDDWVNVTNKPSIELTSLGKASPAKPPIDTNRLFATTKNPPAAPNNVADDFTMIEVDEKGEVQIMEP